jgi:hypothetical protein
MRKLAFVLGLFAALRAIPAAAQPSTLPANTVYGRLGIGAGPGQAIPFSILSANLFLSLPAHGVVVAEGSGTPPVGITPSAAGLPFVSNGASADPSYQALTNAGTNFGVAGSPLYGALGSFYTTTNDADGNANARIHAFRDRIFVDDGVLCSGVAGSNPNFCWSSTRSGTAINNIQWGWVGNGSSLLAVNSWGAFAITGYTVASNAARSGNPYPPSASSAAIGVSGMALNDYATTPFATWAGYFETLRSVTGVGTAIAVEIDAGNVGTIIDMDPFTAFQGTGGWTLGHAVGCGGSAIGVTYTNCSAGIAIAANGAKWRKGITFMSSGLDTSQGFGGGGIALSMGTGQDLQWLFSAGNVGTAITSTNNTTLTGSLLNFNAGGATLSNGGAQFQPQWTLINTHAGTDNAYFVTQKQHGTGVAIANGDSIGTFLVQGFANAAYQSSGSLSWTAGTPSGSNVPSTAQLATSTSGGQLNNILKFDLNAHVDVTSGAAAPTASACTGFALQTGSTDYAGGTAVTNGQTSCVINFGTAFAAAPHCVVSVGGATVNMAVQTSTTQLTVAFGTGVTSLHWICPGS